MSEATISSEKQKITYLVIDLDKKRWREGSRVRIEAYPLYVARNDKNKTTRLTRSLDLSNTRNVSFVFSRDGKFENIEFPQKELENLGEFFRTQKTEDISRDCKAFVRKVKGLPPEQMSAMQSGWMHIYVMDESHLIPGDVIALGDFQKWGDKTYLHAAIYLGQGLYLSRAGIGASLMVTGMDQMRALYPSKFVEKFEPYDEDNHIKPLYSKDMKYELNFMKLENLGIENI